MLACAVVTVAADPVAVQPLFRCGIVQNLTLPNTLNTEICRPFQFSAKGQSHPLVFETRANVSSLQIPCENCPLLLEFSLPLSSLCSHFDQRRILLTDKFMSLDTVCIKRHEQQNNTRPKQSKWNVLILCKKTGWPLSVASACSLEPPTALPYFGTFGERLSVRPPSLCFHGKQF